MSTQNLVVSSVTVPKSKQSVKNSRCLCQSELKLISQVLFKRLKNSSKTHTCLLQVFSFFSLPFWVFCIGQKQQEVLTSEDDRWQTYVQRDTWLVLQRNQLQKAEPVKVFSTTNYTLYCCSLSKKHVDEVSQGHVARERI